MSVQQESRELSQPATDTTDEAPELEYSDVRTDSLMMFGAAIGGAILGMLLTLLMLAIVNGGTLNFAGSAQQVEALQASLERVNENVGAVSENVDIVAGQTAALRLDLVAAEAALTDELANQNAEIDGINDSITALDTTRQQFDVFMGALDSALEEVNSVGQDEVAAASQDNSSLATTDELPLPIVESRADLGPNDVQVVLFADGNNNGRIDEGETSLVGIGVSLLDSGGATAAGGLTGDSGALFEGLEPGEYQLNVDEALGYELLSQSSVAVVLGDSGSQGVAIYIPVDTTAE